MTFTWQLNGKILLRISLLHSLLTLLHKPVEAPHVLHFYFAPSFKELLQIIEQCYLCLSPELQ